MTYAASNASASRRLSLNKISIVESPTDTQTMQDALDKLLKWADT